MDPLSSLSKLGKTGGVRGIAIGAAVLVLGAVAEWDSAVPEAWRGPLLAVVAVGGVLLIVLGMRQRGGDQIAVTDGDGSGARNENAARDEARQIARTRGGNAPAVNKRQ
jgi:hypothetical protein